MKTKLLFPILTAALLGLSACNDVTTPEPPNGGNNGGGVVTPEPQGTFTLTVPSALVLEVGQTTTITPEIGLNSYSGQVTLDITASGLGLIRNGNTVTVTALNPGGFTVTVTARGSDGQTKTAITQVTVIAATQPGGNNQPQPKPLYLPTIGAVVGSGDGTKEGTVYVSPSAQETELLALVNEVRTKGTVHGQPATAGTCVDGSWSPRPALTYNGLHAYAARKHAAYMSNVGYEGHNETQTASPFFYGSLPRDRVVRTYREQAGLTKDYLGDNNTYDGGELVVSGTSWGQPFDAINWWLHSPLHCAALMEPETRQMGTGYAYSVPNVPQKRWGHAWALIVSR